MSELTNYPSSGRWTWNDNLNGLEFISANQTVDRADKKYKEKRQAKDNRGSSGCGYGRQGRAKPISHHRSPTRQGIKQTHDHTTVTLQDVKEVAKYMLSEVEPIAPAFEQMFSTHQLDEFLVLLLNYFHWFFDRLSREANPNPVHIETSLAEKKYLAEMKVKLESAQKQLGRAYGVLILGIGMCDEHHMSCGKSRVSNTYRDRSTYETLYSFCTFVVWIAFRRREHDILKREINRMLRTDTFNPVLRIKNADVGEDELELKLSPAEYRRTQGNRPPIKSIVTQRSVALVSILPLPREEADWLFKRTPAVPPTSPEETGQEDLTEEPRDLEFKDLNFDMENLNIGIIGEPLDQFNLLTLTPLDEEMDDRRNPLQTELPNVAISASAPDTNTSSNEGLRHVEEEPVEPTG